MQRCTRLRLVWPSFANARRRTTTSNQVATKTAAIPLASEEQSVAHEVLDFLPALAWLGSGSRLLKLFQPLERARRTRWLGRHLHPNSTGRPA